MYLQRLYRQLRSLLISSLLHQIMSAGESSQRVSRSIGSVSCSKFGKTIAILRAAIASPARSASHACESMRILCACAN